MIRCCWCALLWGCLVIGGVSAAEPGQPVPRQFLRGMGWSPWHAVYGWGRPPAVVQQDYQILHDLHVNALRTWGGVSRANADTFQQHGLFILPGLTGVGSPRMLMADGAERQVQYVSPEAQATLAGKATKLATELRGHPGVVGYLLGNEYSWVGQNKSGDYQSLGFDEPTLKAFRADLKQRFGTIEQWRKLTGRDDASFEAIRPPTGSGKDLFYWEWWRFQREVFGQFMAAGHQALHAADPDTPSTYALLCGGRWDAATEDADLPFLGIQGDNLYWHWGKNWLAYCVRLARRIGPARPIYITETGLNTWTVKDPAAADRLMRQMLWVLALHPEVKGIFPFVYCDEWWHGKDPKAQDTGADAWGIVTADRQPKSTYPAVQQTYAEFERLADFMDQRESPVELLVSDQALDRWRGVAGPRVDEVCRELYRRGVSFRLVSLLRPTDLAQSGCRHLLLLDSTLPDNPDQTSPARDALRRFVTDGGRIDYLCAAPWRGSYRPDGADGIAATQLEPTDLAADLTQLLSPRPFSFETDGEVYSRMLTAAGRRYLLLVSVGEQTVELVRLRGLAQAELISADGAQLETTPTGLALRGLRVYALLALDGGS